MDSHLHIFATSLKTDQKCTTATLGTGTAYIYPLCGTAADQRAFTFRGEKLSNSLPDEFQSITNLDLFKVKIKQHFLRLFLEN